MLNRLWGPLGVLGVIAFYGGIAIAVTFHEPLEQLGLGYTVSVIGFFLMLASVVCYKIASRDAPTAARVRVEVPPSHFPPIGGPLAFVVIVGFAALLP